MRWHSRIISLSYMYFTSGECFSFSCVTRCMFLCLSVRLSSFYIHCFSTSFLGHVAWNKPDLIWFEKRCNLTIVWNQSSNFRQWKFTVADRCLFKTAQQVMVPVMKHASLASIFCSVIFVELRQRLEARLYRSSPAVNEVCQHRLVVHLYSR